MIKSKVRIHDNFSAIIDVTYNNIFKKSKYTTITYLFIPDSLNINSKTYPSTKFYNDTRLLLEYDKPNYTLNNINIGNQSLLSNLIKNTDKFLEHRNEKYRTRLTDQVKMFVATFCSLIRHNTSSLLKAKHSDPDAIITFLDKMECILAEFRDVVLKIKESSLSTDDKCVMLYADEHLSNVIESQTTKLLQSQQSQNSDSDIPNALVDVINSEQRYKKQKEYDSPKDKYIKSEDLLYKRNQLKKYIESIFFLNQNIRKDGAVFEQSLLALAAGLAMIFSTGIAFYYQQVYGNFTRPFFIALVVSYMLKDRIKGLISVLFVSKSNSIFYDYKIKITNSLSRKIGLIKENFVFVPLKKLGPKVKAHRLKGLVVKMDIEALSEQVIQYKKKIVIYPKRFGNDLPDENINGLTDITRLNFHRFIQYMDDPKKDYILIKKGEVINKVANKMYHINIIQKHYTEEGIEFSRYCVHMNRNGIKRIKKVAL